MRLRRTPAPARSASAIGLPCMLSLASITSTTPNVLLPAAWAGVSVETVTRVGRSRAPSRRSRAEVPPRGQDERRRRGPGTAPPGTGDGCGCPARGGCGSGRERDGRARQRARCSSARRLTARPPLPRGRLGRRCRSEEARSGSSMPRFSNLCRKLGRRPVALKRPDDVRSPAVTSSILNLNSSCSVITSDSIRCTSVIAVTRREPSSSRSRWTIRSSAEATCCRIARTGRS